MLTDTVGSGDPLFSLILPVLNGMRGLERATAALQEQTYRNFELIVQDGGSTDGTLDYLAQVSLPRIDIVSEPDTGKAQAFNRAVRRCQGPLIVPITCTGWLEPNALETFIQWYRERTLTVPSTLAPSAYGAPGPRSLSTLQPEHFELLRFMRGEMFPDRRSRLQQGDRRGRTAPGRAPRKRAQTSSSSSGSGCASPRRNLLEKGSLSSTSCRMARARPRVPRKLTQMHARATISLIASLPGRSIRR